MQLSIIVPALNEEKYLPILLSSLSRQANKQFEIIVVDGKSEDKTREKALEFKDRLDIKVYDSDKRNLCFQRNLGAKKAKGDYLIFIDADYWAEDSFMGSVHRKIVETNKDVIIPVIIYSSKRLFWRRYSVFAGIFNRTIYSLFKKPFTSGSALVIKRSIFDKIGRYDESIFYCEDQTILDEAKKNNVKMQYLKDLTVYSSARRMDKSGILKFFYILVMAGFYILFKGPIRKKIFEFEMGGQAHEVAS